MTNTLNQFTIIPCRIRNGGMLQSWAHLESDGVGMGLSFPGEGCMPCDEEIACGVVQLFERGHGDQVTLSQDVFLKVQLRRYGGNGYAHVLRSFLPRLNALGLVRSLRKRL